MLTRLPLLVLLLAADPTGVDTPRERNPFAPSLPLLTDAEEEQLDRTINRFILYDTGKLPPSEGKKAVVEFQRLGPAAIPALIRGMNRAAAIEHSCPAVTIARKLTQMLRNSNDPELLEFARENMGAGVTRSRHMGVIRDLRVLCMIRKNSLPPVPPPTRLATAPNELRVLTLSELTDAVAIEEGPRAQQALTELVRRGGNETLVNLLTDENARVRAAAHAALVRLGRGTDFGPGPNASAAERVRAMEQWRNWLAQQEGKQKKGVKP